MEEEEIFRTSVYKKIELETTNLQFRLLRRQAREYRNFWDNWRENFPQRINVDDKLSEMEIRFEKEREEAKISDSIFVLFSLNWQDLV
jgi:hypothetical protein